MNSPALFGSEATFGTLGVYYARDVILIAQLERSNSQRPTSAVKHEVSAPGKMRR